MIDKEKFVELDEDKNLDFFLSRKGFLFSYDGSGGWGSWGEKEMGNCIGPHLSLFPLVDLPRHNQMTIGSYHKGRYISTSYSETLVLNHLTN